MPLSAAPNIATALKMQIPALLMHLQLVRKRFLWLFSCTALAMVIFVTTVFYLLYPHPDALWVPVTLLSFALSLALLNTINKIYRRRITEALIRGMTANTGLRYIPEGVRPVETLLPHKIVPDYKDAATSNGYSGWYENTTVSLQSVTAKRGGKTVHWLVMLVQFVRPLAGHIVIMTGNAARTYFFDRFDDFGVIGISDPAYDRQLNILATNRSEGRLLANPPMIEAFFKAGLHLKSQWAAASFQRTEACFIFDDSAMQDVMPGLAYAITPDLIRRGTERIELLLNFTDILIANHRIYVL